VTEAISPVSRLIERTLDPAFALTAFGEVRAWNRAIEELTGIATTDATGRQFTSLLAPRGPLGRAVDMDYCERAVRDGGVKSFDMQVRTPDGRHLWLNVSVLVLDPTRSSPALVVHLAHDITSSRLRRATYEQLVQAAHDVVRLADDEPHLVPASPLTEQEQRILRAFAEGLAPGQVARSLGISTQTVRNHLHHVNQKLGTHNRLEAVTHAQRRRFI
jgi:PAS domain S-box-containing protein